MIFFSGLVTQYIGIPVLKLGLSGELRFLSVHPSVRPSRKLHTKLYLLRACACVVFVAGETRPVGVLQRSGIAIPSRRNYH